MTNRAIFMDKYGPNAALFNAQAVAQSTDDLWQIELEKAFGKDAGQARYEYRGQGEPGTPLRLAYEARKAAHEKWHSLKNVN